MRDALGLELVVLYLPRFAEAATLQRYVTSAGDGAAMRARDEVAFDDEAWQLAVASGAPLVFREEASWLVANPFDPPAGPGSSCRSSRKRGSSGSWSRPPPRRCRSTRPPRRVLTLLGDLLAAGIATARLRQQLQGAEIERERTRLAAEIHDGLAQDLALATRELALLESEPAAGARPRERRAAARGGGVGAPRRARAPRGPVGAHPAGRHRGRRSRR